MEFKFRGLDDRTPPSRSSPSPSATMTSCISEQGLHLRANNATAPDLMQSQRDFCTIQREIEKRRIRQEIIAAESMLRGALEEEVRRELMMEREMAMHRASEMGQPIHGTLQSPRDFHVIQRETKKERIRQEILAAELLHRQVLEKEVRRELMMEREMMAMHRASDMGLSIAKSVPSQFPLRDPLMHQLEGGLAFPGNRGLGFRHDALSPMFPLFSDAVRDKSMSALEVNKKDRLIILCLLKPRPEANLCGTKQKASTPPAGLVEPPAMSSKIPKEWGCALCQVTATSATGLHDHLQGKKHKAKEAALRAQNMCKNSSALQQNKPGKQIKVTERRDTADSEMETKVDEESIETEKTVDCLNQKKEDSKNKNKVLPKQKDLNAENQKKENGKPAVKREKTKEAHKKKLKAENQKNENGMSAVKREKTKEAYKKKLKAENRKNENGMSAVKRGKTKQVYKKKLKLKIYEESHQAEKTVDYSNLKKEDSKNKIEEPPKQKDLNAENQDNKNGIPTEKKQAWRKKLKLKEDVQSLQAEQTTDFSSQKKEDSKNKNKELPKQKDLNAENQKNENGKPAGKREKTKEAHKKKLNAENRKNENGMSAVKRGKTKQAYKKKLKLKTDEESHQAEKTVDCSNLKTEDSKNKIEEPPKQKDLNAENQRKKNGMLPAKRVKAKQAQRKKLKFWCEICQVGANSVVVMKAHKKGKKHMARLESNQNGEAAPSATKRIIMASSRMH